MVNVGVRSRVRVTGLGFGFAGRRHQSLKLRVGENAVWRLRELAGALAAVVLEGSAEVAACKRLRHAGAIALDNSG